jgi:hypothetical protein
MSAAEQARRDEPLDPEWDKDPGTGEHLRMRVRRLNDVGPVRVVHAFYMLRSGQTPIWLACNDTAFYWIPRRKTLQTEPFTVLLWRDLEKGLSRIEEARNDETGQNVPMLQLAIRRGAPALQGWLPDDPDAVPTTQIVLEGGLQADIDDLLAFFRERLHDKSYRPGESGDLWG